MHPAISNVVTLLTASTLVAAAGANVQLPFRTIAVSGEAAPDTAADFTGFGLPRLNNNGEVAFSAYITGEVGVSGMWTDGFNGPGNLELIVRQDQPIPGVPGAFWGEFNPTFYSPLINDSGTVAFSGTQAGPDSDTVICRNTGLGLEVLAARGLDAGLAPTIEFDDVSNLFSMNQNGKVAFSARVVGAGISEANDNGIWSDINGSLLPIMREGNLAPSVPGYTFGSSTSTIPLITESAVVFRNYVSNGQDSLWSIWRNENALHTPIAVEDQQTAILGTLYDGVSYGLIGCTTNNDGDVAFPQRFTFNNQDRATMWYHNGVQTDFAAFEDGNAPDGLTIAHIPSLGASFNGAGSYAFPVYLDGAGVDPSNDSGHLICYPGGGMSFAIREGDPAPGLAAGVSFTGFSSSGITLTDNGTYFVAHAIDGPGINPDSDYGLWAFTALDGLQLILKQGDDIEIRPNDVRTITDFRYSKSTGTQEGRGRGTNNNNEIALHLTFADDSSAIIVMRVPNGCLGDVNGDFFVNFTDLNLLLGNWGESGDPGFIDGDVDCDGDVDFDDLNIVLANWATNCLPI